MALAVLALIDPANPAHAGAGWIVNLERHIREDAEEDKCARFKLALKRRDSSLKGIGWEGVARALLEFHDGERISEIFTADNGQVYQAFEILKF